MSALQAILKSMYEDGLQRDKVPQKRKLAKGLHVALTCHSQGVTLKIARDNKFPSMGEWGIVLKNFPYFTGNPTPTKYTDSDGRFTLAAEIPTRKVIAEQMTFP